MIDAGTRTETGRKRAARQRLPVLALAGIGAIAGSASFVQLLVCRVPLRVVLGGSLPLLVGATLVAAVLCLFLGVREFAAARRGELRERPLSPLRTTFVVGVLCWIAFLSLVHPAEKLWMELGIAAGFGLLAAVLLAESPIGRIPGPIRRATDVLLFSLCASALGVEIALRTWAEIRPSQLLARFGDLPESVVRRSRMKPGQIHLGFPCNSTGHYDEEFVKRKPGEHLVVTIGDSFSLGIVPHDYHFTTVCERILGLPVDNMGISSTGPPEYLRMLVDEALPLDPDVVVIDIFVGNDLVLGDPWPNRPAALLRRWLDRESVLLWLVPRRLSKMAEERRELGRKGPIAETPGADVASGQAEDPAQTLRSLPWLADPMLERGSFSVASFRSLEEGRARQNCTAGPSQLANFFDAMRAMKSAAGAKPIFVMLIPDEFQVEDADWNNVLADTRGTVLDRDHPQKVLLPWLAEQGFEVLDLLPILRDVPPLPDGRRHLYHLRNTHFNARGNEVTGKALAQFLKERLERLPNR